MRPFVLIAGLLAFSSFAAASTVFAHFMIQNTFAYDLLQWKEDMTDAQKVGIDGFALNWSPPDCDSDLDWTVDRINDAFTAAQEVNFTLMHSFDMSHIDCMIFWNQSFMQSILTQHATNPATFRWKNDILVSTYGGDNSSIYGNEFFEILKSSMENAGAPISLAPALTSFSSEAQTNPQLAASNLITNYSSIDGFLNWQAWPLDIKANISASPDSIFQSALADAGRTGPYIMAISPWQYKDLDDGDAADSWVAYSDTLFPDRFASITSNPQIKPDIIEILTWNDFTESHYIRDIPSTAENTTDYVALSDMASYVYGQDHFPWRVMAQYYISWWKTGSPPPVTQDQVIYWYRIHPKATICTGGASSTIRNFDLPSDAVFIWALVTQPAEISLSVGLNEYWSFIAEPTGPALNSVPFPFYVPQSGVTPQAAILRGGAVIAWSNGSVPISSACAWQNFNPVVNLLVANASASSAA